MNPNSTHKSELSQGILPVWKYRAETLSDLLIRVKSVESIATDTPVTYAGRLDPMAEGLVLLLLGETCKEKEQYTGLDKAYTFQVLLGVSTDTQDVLGKVFEVKPVPVLDRTHLETAIQEVLKQTMWTYPAFSSRTVDGVPLFIHARAGTLPQDMPQKEGRVEKLHLTNIETSTLSSLLPDIISDIKKVTGDFRQEEIINGWNEVSDVSVQILTFETVVTSGVYVRSIATLLGDKLGAPSLALSIMRTRIGEYEIIKPVF